MAETRRTLTGPAPGKRGSVPKPAGGARTKDLPSDPVPRLPQRLASLVDGTGTWSETASALVGWRPPRAVAPSLAPLLRDWIGRLEAALAPMPRELLVAQELVTTQALLPRRNDDGAQLELWLEAMMKHLRPYPELVVLEALETVQRTHKFRPTPAEVLAIIERDIAGPRDELERMRWLLEIAEKPQLPAPKGTKWADATPEQRAQHDALMAGFNAKFATVRDNSLQVFDPRPVRLYSQPGDGWEPWATQAWLQGYRARTAGTGDASQGMSARAQEFYREGYLAASGVICREFELSPATLALMENTQQPTGGDDDVLSGM
mgnify:CR=1 FL=1